MFVEKFKAGRVVAGAVLMAFALGMSGCGSTPKEDPNSQVALDKLYADAKDDLNAGSYDRAIKSLEKIEGRAAGTTMGQQATLDVAWAYYRTAERAHAIGRFFRQEAGVGTKCLGFGELHRAGVDGHHRGTGEPGDLKAILTKAPAADDDGEPHNLLSEGSAAGLAFRYPMYEAQHGPGRQILGTGSRR